MTFYRKKPVLVEATQWHKNGDHPLDGVGEVLQDPMLPDQTYTRIEGKVVRFFRRPEKEYSENEQHLLCGAEYRRHGWIDTLDGGHIVCPGDWIITGAQGEWLPCKNSIFRETYEQVVVDETPPKNPIAGGLGKRTWVKTAGEGFPA